MGPPRDPKSEAPLPIQEGGVLRHNIINIYGEPMDITQATSKLCAGERMKSIHPKVKVKTDGAFGIWLYINGAYYLRDDERRINFICWWWYNLF